MFINGLNTFIILYLENYSDAHKTSFHLLIAFLRKLHTNFDAFAGLRTRLEIKSKFRVVCLSLVSFFFPKVNWGSEYRVCDKHFVYKI
jgi:hypothetical protein